MFRNLRTSYLAAAFLGGLMASWAVAWAEAPATATGPAGPVLKVGARLAIIGDSITEQKLYSRFIETYLAACAPQLRVQVAQFGWSGETAGGFLRRMDNDLAWFKPDVATTCYGMNDGGYRAYDERIGKAYEENMRAIVDRLKKAGVTVVVGSPGAVDTKYFSRGLPAAVYNDNLAHLCDIARKISGR